MATQTDALECEGFDMRSPRCRQKMFGGVSGGTAVPRADEASAPRPGCWVRLLLCVISGMYAEKRDPGHT